MILFLRLVSYTNDQRLLFITWSNEKNIRHCRPDVVLFVY